MFGNEKSRKSGLNIIVVGGSGYGAVTEASGTGRLHCKRWGFALEYRKGESHNGGRYSAG